MYIFIVDQTYYNTLTKLLTCMVRIQGGALHGKQTVLPLQKVLFIRQNAPNGYFFNSLYYCTNNVHLLPTHYSWSVISHNMNDAQGLWSEISVSKYKRYL
jgi:hypothetical protein